MSKRGMLAAFVLACCVAVPVANASDPARSKRLVNARTSPVTAPNADRVQPDVGTSGIDPECRDACFAEADQIYADCVAAGRPAEECCDEASARSGMRCFYNHEDWRMKCFKTCASARECC